jgi:hypothetical protein
MQYIPATILAQHSLHGQAKNLVYNCPQITPLRANLRHEEPASIHAYICPQEWHFIHEVSRAQGLQLCESPLTFSMSCT